MAFPTTYKQTTAKGIKASPMINYLDHIKTK